MSLFVIDDAKCTRDGICAAVCPLGLIEPPGESWLPRPIEAADELCIACGHCVAVCPHGALDHRLMAVAACPPVLPELKISPKQARQFLRARRSIRTYTDKPVLRETLSELLEMASYAPSGHNSRPVSWLAILDRKDVAGLAGLVVSWMEGVSKKQPEMSFRLGRIIKAWARGEDWICRGAPHIVVAHGAGDLPIALSAATIALTYLELAATSMGLGACWAGYFNAAANDFPPLIEALNLPAGHKCLGTMMIGYPQYKYQRMPVRNQPNITWR